MIQWKIKIFSIFFILNSNYNGREEIYFKCHKLNSKYVYGLSLIIV